MNSQKESNAENRRMNRYHSLSFKHFLTIMLILLVSFVLLGTAFVGFSYRYAMTEKREAMRSAAGETCRIVRAYSADADFNEVDLRMPISSLSNTSGFQIMVCAEDGTVIACSDQQFICGHLGKPLPEHVLISLMQRGEHTELSTLGGIYQQEQYVVAETAVSVREDFGACYVLVSCDPASMAEIWRQFASIFITTAICVILIAFVISVVTIERMTQPINEIAAAAHKFAGGDYAARVRLPERRDEIHELAEAFNTMAESIENQEKQRREFIANVSHELKTPMTTITGFADGILDGTIPPEQQDKYLSTISSETKRLSRLVRNMLETSRLQAVDKAQVLQKSFDITEVVGMTLLGLEQKINARNLDVDAQLPEDRLIVRGEQDSITQVVYNLLDNAVKFADEGTVLRIQLFKQEKKVYVSVENTGTTIEAEELPLIFDRFHKEDRSRSKDPDGVGLGLYIVRTILENHGEDIYVTSENRVTRFVFTLTLA